MDDVGSMTARRIWSMELNQNEKKLAAYRERARELVKQMTLEEKVAQTQN